MPQSSKSAAKLKAEPRQKKSAKTAAEAYRESEERFRSIFENSSVPMVVTDLDGTFLRANDSYCNLTGYSEAELRKTAFHRLTHPEDVEKNMDLFRSMLAGEIPGFTLEKRYIRKDGTIVWVMAGANLLRDADDRPASVVGILQDISARKSAESERTRLLTELEEERSELRAAVQQLRLIEQSVNAGTWHWDVESGISYWPPGISALWGLPPKDHQITFDQFQGMLHPDDKDRVLQTISKSLESTGTYDVQFRVVWPDKSIHWLAARGAMMRDSSGKPSRVVGIAMEATERIRTEEALRQSEKLAATGRLAATIAHEINNPLEAVTNLLFLCSSEPSLPPHIRAYLSQADQELGRVSHIARQTLGFYRESSEPAPVDLASVAKQILDLYSKRLQTKRISLDLRDDNAGTVIGTQGELRQVISNLLLNAIDAVPMQGRIVVRVRRHRDRVRFIVADNGPGISRADRRKLFTPFFTTKKDVGTGLGLWVSKGIVDKHQGRIIVRSRTTKGLSGAVFILELPANAAGSQPLTRPQAHTIA